VSDLPGVGSTVKLAFTVDVVILEREVIVTVNDQRTESQQICLDRPEDSAVLARRPVENLRIDDLAPVPAVQDQVVTGAGSVAVQRSQVLIQWVTGRPAAVPDLDFVTGCPAQLSGDLLRERRLARTIRTFQYY